MVAGWLQAGLVYAVATEDMDALTFGTPRLIRHLMASGVSDWVCGGGWERNRGLSGVGWPERQCSAWRGGMPGHEEQASGRQQGWGSRGLGKAGPYLLDLLRHKCQAHATVSAHSP
jgi:hypothetical protein